MEGSVGGGSSFVADGWGRMRPDYIVGLQGI